MSELYDELHKLAQTEGNEPIRCSRMHFSEWADDVDKLDAEIERLREDLSHERVQLLSAVRALEMFVEEFDRADGTTLEPTVDLIDLARFHVRTNGEAARAAAGGGDDES